jgi:hypothetical protein
MIEVFKKLFTLPKPEELARRELLEARRSLLEAQSCQVLAYRMVQYHKDRIERLGIFLRPQSPSVGKIPVTENRQP